MDYGKHYGTDIRGQFFDPDQHYQDGNYFETKFMEALNEAKESLVLNKSNSKVENNPVVQTLVKLYNIRLKREQAFIKEWEKHFNTSRKGKLAFPMNGNYTPEGNYKYAQDFSKFIQSAVGAADDPIISALRNPSFCQQIAGLSSKVFSTAASKGHSSGNKNQSDINLYYQNLFDTFFFGAKYGDKGGPMPISIEEMVSKGETIGSSIFQERFKNFIAVYYPSISDDVNKYLNQLGAEAAKKIYKVFKKSAPQSFNFSIGQDRGVSEQTEQQLKKMLLSTLRQLAELKGNSYDQFSVKGVLEVHPDWQETEDGFHMAVQMKIDEKKRERTQLRADQAAGVTRNGKKIDMRNYNRTYIVDHSDDAVVDSATGELKQIKTLFLDYLCREIKKFNGHEVTSKERSILSTATFQKIDQTIKRGDKALAAMSAYGPEQMRGLLGEIATAYALQTGNAKTYTEVTGGDRASGKAGGQLHYDVVATINNMNIGFQVKNYSNIDGKGQTLYPTTVGLGTKEMYKYFNANDVRHYRWLYANGNFISKQGFVSNLHEQMVSSFFNSIPNFLRITDAQDTETGIQSDIYVLGNFYIPSSYLICCAIKEVKRELQSSKGQEMFTFSTEFPNYRRKMPPTDITRTNADGTTRQSQKHKSAYIDKNIIWINDTKKTGIFGKAKINFSGINIKFTI